MKLSRILLGSFLVATGIGHLTFARKAFRAQVPDEVPLDKDDTVVYSGWAELALAGALLIPGKHEEAVGKVAAAFFIAVFPGNLEQYVRHRDMPGLDSDQKRLVRLFFQPLLVYWALTSSDK